MREELTAEGQPEGVSQGGKTVLHTDCGSGLTNLRVC